MVEEIIACWISDYNSLNPNELQDHYSAIVHNDSLINALYTYFEDFHKFYKVVNNVEVCGVLFKYYRLGEDELKRFTLQFLPQVLYTYLNSVAHADKKTSRVMEALLIGIYNLEVVDENGQSRVISFRLPSLAQSSIYHEPVSLAPASLTESALKRLEQRDSQLVRWGPLRMVDKLIAQNRLAVLTELLFCYNRHISLLTKQSLEHLCKVTCMIVTQGFSRNTSAYSRRSSVCSKDGSFSLVLPRIPVSSLFLCQLLQCLYYAMFNGYKYESQQAIEDVFCRASYHCYHDVLLLANAIKNSYSSQTGQPESTPSNIGVTLSSTSHTTTLSKSMITNASFRTKKLPDDIPIQDPTADDPNNGLSSITEEKEDSVTPEIHARKSLPKMAASFGKKTKEKIVIAVKSTNSSAKNKNNNSNSIAMNGISEDVSGDESGIDVSDISTIGVTDAEGTPFNNRKNTTATGGVNIEMDVTRPIQVSSV